VVLIVVWAAAQAAVSHVVISRQMAYNRKIADLDSRLTVLSHLLKTEVVQKIRFDLDFLMNIENPEVRAQALKHFQEADLKFNKHLEHLTILAEKDPDSRRAILETINNIKELDQSYSRGFFQLADEMEYNRNFTALDAHRLAEAHKETIQQIEDIISKLGDQYNQRLKQTLDDANEIGSRAIVYVLLAANLGLLTLLTVGYLLWRSIRRLIEELSCLSFPDIQPSTLAWEAGQRLVDTFSDPEPGGGEPMSAHWTVR
jgi:hypothetical protein